MPLFSYCCCPLSFAACLLRNISCVGGLFCVSSNSAAFRFPCFLANWWNAGESHDTIPNTNAPFASPCPAEGGAYRGSSLVPCRCLVECLIEVRLRKGSWKGAPDIYLGTNLLGEASAQQWAMEAGAQRVLSKPLEWHCLRWQGRPEQGEKEL